jgi:phage tail-like protein
MALPELDKAVDHSFGLEFDGVQIRHIQEVTGPKMEQDVIGLKQNSKDGKYAIKKVPGSLNVGEVTLTRGLTKDDSFETLMKDARLGEMGEARKNGAIIVYGYEGTALKRYKLSNCWPKSLEIGTLKAGDTSVLTEKLTVTFESIELE